MTPIYKKIENFAAQMQIEIDNNQHKGDINHWNNITDMIVELEYHKGKLLDALKKNNHVLIKEYIADCANILMAIGNVGGLYDEVILEVNGSTIEDVINDVKSRAPKETIIRNPCRICQLNEKVVGENLCRPCLKINPFFCV